MSQELSDEDRATAMAAVEQVLAECRPPAERTLQEWIDNGQDTSIALRDIADGIVRGLVEEYQLDWSE